MAYFLKTSHYKKGDYLQIYDSFRDPVSKKPKNKCWKTLGYVEDLKKQGITDPVAYFKEEINELNEERRKQRLEQKTRNISTISAKRNLGYFPGQILWNTLDASAHIEQLTHSSLRFNAAGCIHDLLMSWLLDGQETKGTLFSCRNELYGAGKFTEEQISSCLNFCGQHYKEIISTLRRAGQSFQDGKRIRDKRAYFGFAQYSFNEEFSSTPDENWRSQLLNTEHCKLQLGILLDETLVPQQMNMYGPLPEQQVDFETAASDMKREMEIQKRVIRVADKLLNNPEHIQNALQAGDGYLYACFFETLSEAEQEWIADLEGSVAIRDSNQEEHWMKSMNRSRSFSTTKEGAAASVSSCQEKVVLVYTPSKAAKEKSEIVQLARQADQFVKQNIPLSEFGSAIRYVQKNLETEVIELDQKAIDRDLKSAGKLCLVCSETDLEEQEILSIYQELWRMKESLQSIELQKDPVLLKGRSKNKIIGCFLICFLSLILEKRIRSLLLEDRFTARELQLFMNQFQVVERLPSLWINCCQMSDLLKFLEEKYGFPLSCYELEQSQIDHLLEFSLSSCLAQDSRKDC